MIDGACTTTRQHREPLRVADPDIDGASTASFRDVHLACLRWLEPRGLLFDNPAEERLSVQCTKAINIRWARAKS